MAPEPTTARARLSRRSSFAARETNEALRRLRVPGPMGPSEVMASDSAAHSASRKTFSARWKPSGSRFIPLPNDIEFSGERKRVRCNEGLDNRKSQQKRESWRHERGENKGLPAPKVLNEELPKFRNSEETDGTGARPTG